MSDNYHSYAILCRDCFGAGYLGAVTTPDRCAFCGAGHLLVHDELFDLAIAHIDCDAFYCSVEKRDHPELQDRPVIVGGGRRGVVAAACYQARKYGIRSAMPSWQALKACPDLVVLKPRMAHYQKVSRQIKQKMMALTPLVQPLSIDEAFLDLSGTQKLHGCSPAEVLARFQAEIRIELGLTVSVGLAPNKSLAKIASDQDKPDGFYVIGQAEAESWLSDKAVSVIYGVGKTACARLNAQNIMTCADLTSAPEHLVKAALGTDANRLTALARGLDERPVTPHSAPKSVSSETTFERDLSSRDELLAIAEQLCMKVSRSIKAKQVKGRKVTLKLKLTNHRILTRTHSLSQSTQMAHELFTAVQMLLDKELAASRRAYRLLGVGVELASDNDSAQMRFDDSEQDNLRQNSLEEAIDQIHSRLGDDSLKTGRQFSKHKWAKHEGEKHKRAEDKQD